MHLKINLIEGQKRALEGQIRQQDLTCRYSHQHEKVTFLLKGSEVTMLKMTNL